METSTATRSATRSATVQQIYNQIKNLEGQFPIPTPAKTVDMGTYNPTSGKFSGLVSKLERLEEEDGSPAPNPKPPLVSVPPEIEIDAVNVVLRFKISTPHGPWKVTANGKEVSGTTSQNTLTVDCGRASQVEWNVQGGGHVYRDKLIVHRPLIIGAGAFTVPALPVVLLYEPPSRPNPDRTPNNFASYAATTSVGTVVTTSFSTASSSTTPVASRFESVANLRSTLSTLATAAGGLGQTGIKSALNGIASALGQASASMTQGTQVTNEHTLAVTQTFTEETSTGANDGGPGVGDQIRFLLNARLVWLASGNGLQLALIGYDAVVLRSVAALKANRDAEPSGISPEVVDALLALDPFVVGGPKAALPSDRYAHVETYDVNGGELAISASQTVTQTDLQARTRTTIKVDDMRAGALAFLGIGVTQTETITTTVTQRNVASTSQSQTVTAGGKLFADIDEQYVIEVLFDRVFGTFAFRRVSGAATPVLAGVLRSTSETSLAGRRVVVTSGGKRYVTVTGRSGTWSFRAPGIAPGQVTVRSGNATKTVNLAGSPVKDIELDVR